MKTFITDDFLLHNEAAKKLFHGSAETMPIIDYHSHLDPAAICHDINYPNISELWLGEDHYKWRLMRAMGVPEQLITGGAEPQKKFCTYAGVLAYAIGNPNYHWSNLELARFFELEEPLTAENADRVYEKCNELLAKPGFSVRNLLRRMRVKVLCTTDDPASDLRYHRALQDEQFEVRVLPTFRLEKALTIQNTGFLSYLSELASAANQKEIRSLYDLERVLRQRVDFFAESGCVISDHSLESDFFTEVDRDKAAAALALALEGKTPGPEAILAYKSYLLVFMAQLYYEKNWAMQFHIGALRNNSRRMFERLGPDAGYDAMQDFSYVAGLGRFFSELEYRGHLPKTIVYPLNSKDYDSVAAMLESFQGVCPAFSSGQGEGLLQAENLTSGAGTSTEVASDSLRASCSYGEFGSELASCSYGKFGSELADETDFAIKSMKSGKPAKMQFGAAWWFQDHKAGIENQLKKYATNGVLGSFIGMLTDSRSFLSLTRHEYFRRILCNYLGELVEKGEYAEDMKFLNRLVQNICYYNVKTYLNL